MNFLEKTKTVILVHQKMSSIPQGKERIHILLSPQFYTIKREALPVKYAYQAKRIAPSLFEGLLEEGQSYRYFVIKEEESWLFIAYSEESITAFLKQKEIPLLRIDNIYFAQQSLHAFTAPVKMGEEDALVNLNETVTIVPQSALPLESRFLQVDERFIPKKGIRLEGEGNRYFGKKEAYVFSVIFLLFAMMYVAEGIRYKKATTVEKEKLETLLSQYPTLESSYKRKSILDTYSIIDKKERKKRDSIKAVSRMIFKGSTLNSLIVDNKQFKAQFECKDAKIAKQVQRLAKEAQLQTGTLKNNHLIIEEQAQ